MPLRSIETEEQRQQRFLARDLERKRKEQGLSSLPGQAAWMGGLIAPTSGITDYAGLYPEMPRGEGITGETMPSFAENIQDKRYLDAFYQGLGLTGDLAMGAGVFYPPLLPLAAAMKTTSAIGKAAKASKQVKLRPKYKIDEKGEVTNADFLEIKLPKSYRIKIHARYAETADGKFIMHPRFGAVGEGAFKEADYFGFFDKPIVGLPKVSDPVFDSLDEVKVALIDRALESGKITDDHALQTYKIREKLRSEKRIPVKPDDILELPASAKTPDIDRLPEDPQKIIKEEIAPTTKAEPDPFAIADPRGRATADELLDWQKPLTEQQPAVQEKIKNLIGEDFFNQAVADGHTGEEVYNRFNDAMLRDDLAQYGLEFLEPSLSTEKLGAGAYLNEAGIKGIVYDRGSVEVFDPLKYKKVDPGAKLSKSLQTPKTPAALTNKRISAHTLLRKRGGFDPSEKFQEELWSAFPEPYIQKKYDKSGGFKMHESVPRWARSKQSEYGEFTGMRDIHDLTESWSEVGAGDFEHFYTRDSSGNLIGDPDEVTRNLLLKDELIPEQADELLKWNKTVEEQERTIDLLESGGYTPEGMMDEEVDIALEKIFADQETVEVEVFDFSDDDIPEFNSGGPVTKPLYADRRYI